MLAAGLIAGAVGVTVLVGWSLHSTLLVQVVATAAPMQRMTALAFVLSGIALVLAGEGRKQAAAICFLFVFLEAALVCLEYALSAQFGIDELLGRDYILVHVSHAGRMSAVSSLCFLASSLAVLASVRRRPMRFEFAFVGTVASVLLAVGIVGILGYILGKTELYGWSHFNRVGLLTSAGFAALGAGLMAWAWQESKTAEGSPEWLPLSIGLGLAAAALGVWQALIAHDSGHLQVLSGVILAGGIFGAALMAVAAAQTQRAHKRSRELLASSAMLHQLFDASPDGLIMVSTQGVILRINRQAEAIFGYGPNQLLGSLIEELVPVKLREGHQSYREAYNAAPRSRPMGPGLELNARRKDGSEFPIEIALTPIESAEKTPLIVALVRDVTEGRRADEALRLSEERFRSAFEHGPIGVTLLGTDGRMIKANPELCRMFGYSEEELARMTPLEITHPADLNPSRNLMEHLFTDDVSIKKLVKRYVKKNGQIMWGSLSVSVIRDREGHPLYAISMVEDITDRKLAEAELRLGNEIIANMEGGLCLVRANDGVIVDANPSFEKMFDYGPGELAGKHVAMLNAPGEKQPEEVAREIIEVLSRDGVWRGEVLNRRKDGSAFWSSATISTFDHPGFGKVWISILQDITARKQSEQTLSKQAALLDLARDAVIVCDLENRITSWNRGAADTYGWSAEEALGRLNHELLQTRSSISIEGIRDALRRQGEWEGEMEHVRRDGRTIVVASRWSLARDKSGRATAILKINRDITHRKRAEEQLRNLTERLSLATRTASIGIWDLDLRTNRVVWDDTTFAIFGIANAVPLPQGEFARRVHPDDLAAVEAAKQRAIQGKTQEFVEFRIIRPDGSVRHVSTAEGAVLDEHGNAVRLVGTAVDITERKEMEAQIEASKEQMLASARLSALGMMAGGVAHEINNPLSIIHASAAELQRRIKEEGTVPLRLAERSSERILETANRITKIIKSMRHLAREGSQDRVRPSRVSKITEDTLEVCKERFKDHAVDLRLPRIDPALSVSCREVQIEQVLLNLLQNAFDAVVEQPGEKWIDLGVTVRGDAVEFSVTDSGPGIPPELRTKIMEPFFTTKDVGKGVGLGLSLSRRIVEDHGSTLELTEEDGHPCFSFCLPLARKEELISR
jgi:PAS domain S-box-containing protein